MLKVISTFPKSVRLRKRADFVSLTTSDCKYGVKGFLVVWHANNLHAPRVGVTVSRKVGCAVVRNRIKRYLREIFRRNRELIPFVDLNIIARREASSMDFSSVQNEVMKAFRHIGERTCSRASHSL